MPDFCGFAGVFYGGGAIKCVFFCFGVGCFNALPGKLPVGFRYYFCFVYCSGKNVAPCVLRFWFGGVFGGEIGVAFTFVCVAKLGLCDFVFRMIESFKFVLFDISSLG